jgi:hypothetical protein
MNPKCLLLALLLVGGGYYAYHKGLIKLPKMGG